MAAHPVTLRAWTHQPQPPSPGGRRALMRGAIWVIAEGGSAGSCPHLGLAAAPDMGTNGADVTSEDEEDELQAA